MEIIEIGVPRNEHQLFCALDRLPGSGYIVTRKIQDIVQRTNIKFNPFELIQDQLVKNPGGVCVLEGGSGVSIALSELKTGVSFDESIIQSPDKQTESADLIAWKHSLIGQRWEGIPALYTTGSTLTARHVDLMPLYGVSNVDKMLVGPLEDYVSPVPEQDFIYDFFGPAFYFPDPIIPKYGRMLNIGGIAFMRLEIVTESDLKESQILLITSGFSIRDMGIPRTWDKSQPHRCFVDVLVEKTRQPRF